MEEKTPQQIYTSILERICKLELDYERLVLSTEEFEMALKSVEQEVIDALDENIIKDEFLETSLLTEMSLIMQKNNFELACEIKLPLEE